MDLGIFLKQLYCRPKSPAVEMVNAIFIFFFLGGVSVLNYEPFVFKSWLDLMFTVVNYSEIGNRKNLSSSDLSGSFTCGRPVVTLLEALGFKCLRSRMGAMNQAQHEELRTFRSGRLSRMICHAGFNGI